MTDCAISQGTVVYGKIRDAGARRAGCTFQLCHLMSTGQPLWALVFSSVKDGRRKNAPPRRVLRIGIKGYNAGV